jgi:hypothetical protein
MHREFVVHMLDAQGVAKTNAITEAFDVLLTKLEGIMDPTHAAREMAMVRIKLEEACYFATKAVASQPDGHP